MDRRRIAIVIPALNEARTVGTVVARAMEYGQAVVVDDGSTDRTSELAVAGGACVVRHERNAGYDAALNSGAAKARELGCEFFITMDADGQHDPTTLPAFVAALAGGADVVVGIRDRHQRIAESLFAMVTRMRWGIRDPLCGMKGYRTGIYIERGHFDTYGSIGTELLLYAARVGHRILQLPMKTRDRADAPRFGRRWSANMRILRACWLGAVRGRETVRQR